MIIAEFTIDHPVLDELLASVPDIEVHWGQTFEQLSGPTHMVIWILSDDFDAVEAALAADPSVENPRILADAAGRRLYRIDLTSLGRGMLILPKIVEVGGVLQKAVGTDDGWWCRSQLPTRRAFEEVYRWGLEKGIGFTFHRLYESSNWLAEPDLDLTPAQRETLIEAVESGYLAIPRECSLAELGERLGVSESAASERFRRAVLNLVNQTLM